MESCLFQDEREEVPPLRALKLDLQAVLAQQARNARMRELRFFHPVHFRVDAVIAGGAEIRFFQDGIHKRRFQEVTIPEKGLAQVDVLELHFFHRAACKLSFDHFLFKESRIIQLAVGEAYLEQEIVAVTEVDAAELTAGKVYMF